MKVLSVLFERLLPPSGGGTPRTRALIDALRRRGHEVHVTCGSELEPQKTRELLGVESHQPLLEVDRLDRNKMLKYLVCHPINIRRTVAHARRVRPDVVVAHNAVAGLAALEVRRRLPGVRFVLDLTDLLFDYLDAYADGNGRSRFWLGCMGKAGRLLEHKAIRQADRVITMSEAMRTILIDLGAAANRTVVVPDGVDTGKFRPFRNDRLRASISPWAESVVVFHGVVDPQDEPLLLVDAAKAIVKDHPRTAFWVVGDGAALLPMRRRVVQSGLSRHFHFTGWVPASLVPRYVAAADLGLVILPDARSARGRLTLKGFECWAVGIPVVLPDLPGLSEVVQHADAARTYEPGKAASLAASVHELLADRSLRRELGERGLQMVGEHYAWDRLGEAMSVQIERAAAPRGGDAGAREAGREAALAGFAAAEGRSAQ
ncbi:MAG: glycosyltransferase family 4 protein [Planctomycetota bacterium]